MKRRLAGLLFLLACVSGKVYAYEEAYAIGSSCFTSTNDTTLVIVNTVPGTIFLGVVVSSPMATGSITLYDSSATATGQIGVVSFNHANSGGANYIPFNVKLSSGLTYTTAGNSTGVTIIFRRAALR